MFECTPADPQYPLIFSVDFERHDYENSYSRTLSLKPSLEKAIISISDRTFRG